MTREKSSYTYKAYLLRVVDGDTVDLRVDLGFHLTAELRFRVLGVDTPELRGKTKLKALVSKGHTEAVLRSSPYLSITTTKTDSFGRWLADVFFLDGVTREWKNLAESLIENGLGVPRGG